jgi:PII-like signaling protein
MAIVKENGPGKLLRIFVGGNARADRQPLHEAIVLKAREHGLAVQ